MNEQAPGLLLFDLRLRAVVDPFSVIGGAFERFQLLPELLGRGFQPGDGLLRLRLAVREIQDAATKRFDVDLHRFARTRAVIRAVLGGRLGVGDVLVADPFVLSSGRSHRGRSRDTRGRRLVVK